MIIFLIILGIAVFSLIAWKICEKKRDVYSSFSPESLLVLGLVASVWVVIMAISIGIVHSPRYQEKNLREWQLKRESIVWQMRNDLYVGGALDDYNTGVYAKQYQYKNPWTSWFHGEYVMELELIDTGEVSQTHWEEGK